MDVGCQVNSKTQTKFDPDNWGKKKHFDVKARERRFEKGDKALLLLPTCSNKFQMQWQGPFEVVDCVARHNYKLQVRGKVKIYHAKLMKKYVEKGKMERSA